MEVKTSAIAGFLDREIQWFEKLVDQSLSDYFNNEAQKKGSVVKPPKVSKTNSPYEELISIFKLEDDDRLVLILALLPLIKPQSLDIFLIKNKNLDCEYSEFGGIKNSSIRGFHPTLETACFILHHANMEGRLNFLRKFNKHHPFFSQKILQSNPVKDQSLQVGLEVSSEYIGFLVNGEKQLPHLNVNFPAKEISTDLEWKDLVVDEKVEHSLLELKDWLLHHDTILNKWKLKKYIKPGYRALFHGPPGTGKTLAATLLGKVTARPVFRVDLSLVVSKYIGETEKNLGQLFDQAENKEWILFFDEADALFGKRTHTRDAHDRYANQEVSYLLQRIEDFKGLVILATNMQGNMDEAFSRRFQSMIHFTKPGKEERLKLWKGLFGKSFKLDPQLDLEVVAEQYELTGGEMVNVLSYCALQAAKREKKEVMKNDLVYGIRREYTKSNKTL